MSEELEAVLRMPRPEAAYENLPQETQDVLKDVQNALAEEMRECTEALKALDPVSREYLSVCHIRASALEQFRKISGAEGAEEQAAALGKALIKVEAKLEENRRALLEERALEKKQAMTGFITSTNPAELAEHIAQQDAVDAERGIKKDKESPLMRVARKHAKGKDKKK
ncbi:MAG: hypothetical protein P1U85_20730 [Verrucomicrobiales bacterium]|jgi:hypothetical protein|nr:hypothetical protein [Verrucomicrobiales bacterium]